jgi:hypothetical protein
MNRWPDWIEQAVPTKGSLPEWVAAVFTSLAFFIAARAYSRDVRIRREAQARLVYSKIPAHKAYGPGELFPVVANDAPVGVNDGSVALMLPSEPHQQAMNRAKVGVLQVTVIVSNGSDELIGPGKVQLVDTGRGTIFNSLAAPIGFI